MQEATIAEMKNTHIGIVLAVLVVGLFVVFKFTPAAQFFPTSRPVPSENKTFTLIVQNRKLVSGPEILSANQGDSVTIHITVDEDEELHLHGYNLHVDLKKGIPGSLSFVASSSGRFPYELEHSSTEIGALEVQPR
jgi:hypothetical protein